MLILLFACTLSSTSSIDEGRPPADTDTDTALDVSADTDVDTGTDTGADTGGDTHADTGTEDTGASLDACPAIDRWTDNAAFPVGETITWSPSGCGVPVHFGCIDPAVALSSFAGMLDADTFTWSVTAVGVGATTCSLTLADPRDDDRADYVVAITVPS